jgi:hypothetical protein
MTPVPGGDIEAGLAAPALPSTAAPGRARAWAHGGLRWLAEHRLVLAAGLLAAVPVIASTVRALSAGWVPLGDDGVIVVRSFDVLTLHPPLLGQYSNSSGVTGQELHSLGPLLYWLLALPARYLGYSAPVLAVGLVNLASVMGVVALARRRAGVPLMIATAIAVAVMCGSLNAEALHDVWNPAVALLPFTLLIFVGWSLAGGEHRWLPLAVLLASFCAQCHITYVLPSLGLLVIGIAGVVLARRGSPPASREPIRRWVIAAALVAAVCWSAPLLDQAIHRPGNFVVLGRTAEAQKSTLGSSAGLRAVVRAVGVPPWWLRPAPDPVVRLHELSGRPPDPPGALAIGSCVLIIGAVFATVLLGRRRRRWDIVAAGTISLVLCATLALAIASTPTKDNLFLSVGYTSWWGSPAGMWVWLTLGWSVVALGLPGRRLAALRLPRIAPAIGVAVAGIVAVLIAASAGPDPLKPAFRPMRTIIDGIDARVPQHRRVFVDSAATYTGIDFQPAVVLALRRRGTPVVTAALLPALGQQYNPSRGYDDVLRIDEGDRPAPPGGRVIARVSVPRAHAPGELRPAQGRVTVTLVPARR